MDTFVVRLWNPADPAELAGSGLRGIVSHLATGRSAAFGDGPALLVTLDELRRPVTNNDAVRVPTDETRPDTGSVRAGG